jgi:hypothetical protein
MPIVKIVPSSLAHAEPVPPGICPHCSRDVQTGHPDLCPGQPDFWLSKTLQVRLEVILKIDDAGVETFFFGCACGGHDGVRYYTRKKSIRRHYAKEGLGVWKGHILSPQSPGTSTLASDSVDEHALPHVPPTSDRQVWALPRRAHLKLNLSHRIVLCNRRLYPAAHSTLTYLTSQKFQTSQTSRTSSTPHPAMRLLRLPLQLPLTPRWTSTTLCFSLRFPLSF